MAAELVYQIFDTVDQMIADMLKRNHHRISTADKIELMEMLSAHYGEIADLLEKQEGDDGK